ncbi:MAG: hypothetical protein ABIO57_00385 [Candidatus Paceibacterota bacterium]
MKNLQKGSTVITLTLVIILLIIALIGAYLYSQHTQTIATVNVIQPVGQTTQPTTVTTTTTTPPPAVVTEPALPPHATPSPLTKVYTDSKFGFSASYPQTHTASTDKAGKVTFAIPGSTIMPITLVKATNTADTSTGKWGKNVLSYSNSGWVTQLQNPQDGSLYSAATVPFAFTTSGLPIFSGGTRHGFGLSVYVVALAHTKFLIISGGEGLTTATGYDYSTDPTLQIAKSVTAL